MPSTTSRPRLLFLSHLLPYPPDSGAAIRTHHVLRLLSRSFDITALCFYRAADTSRLPSIAERVEALSEFAEVAAFPLPADLTRARFAWDHLRSVLTGLPYVRYTYESRPFRERLDSLLSTRQFDVAHIDSLDLCGYLPLLRGLPVVCVHHNVESALLRRRADAEHSPARRSYLRRQALLLERSERHWGERVTLNVTVSEADRQQLRALAPRGSYLVVPNGVDTEEYRPGPADGQGLVFVGGTTWFPNREALDFFRDEILPRLRQRGCSEAVRWVGQTSAEDRKRHAGVRELDLVGYVDDVRPYIRDAACFIVPLRTGGGTRLKILNAWAMGKAVVSTSVGCEGLEAVNGENIVIADTAEAFAEAVARLLRDPRERRRLGERARATAEAVYAWEVIGEPMTEAYATLAGAGGRSARRPGPRAAHAGRKG